MLPGFLRNQVRHLDGCSEERQEWGGVELISGTMGKGVGGGGATDLALVGRVGWWSLLVNPLVLGILAG